jgi:ATP-dependent RNA helicase DHX37/DHR1
VVATNVAETSLTIPGIRYVVDCGRAKQVRNANYIESGPPVFITFPKREYDSQNGIQTFKIAWIPKASAAQRAGRAGRTGPGHCYRLYSSAVFENNFEAFSEPEILRVPIEGVVLQMKSMHIDAVVNFPFPNPPDRLALRKAETLLTHLNALGFSPPGKPGVNGSNMSGSHMTIGGHITELGKAMALFPVSPRFSKMLVAARLGDSLPYVIAVVASLSVGNPFLHENFLDSKTMEANEHQDDDRSATDGEEDVPVELDQIKNPEVRAKELRKVERHRFFKALQACHSSVMQCLMLKLAL